MEIGLSIGSNQGDRIANLRLCRDRLSAFERLALVAQSPVYESEPVDVDSEYQAMSFLNAVLIIETDLDVMMLAGIFHSMENSMGRMKTNRRNEPRVIDIDIIYAGKIVMADDKLVIPHPRWTARRFVVQPLADVRPDVVIAPEKRSVREILSALPREPWVTLFTREW